MKKCLVLAALLAAGQVFAEDNATCVNNETKTEEIAVISEAEAKEAIENLSKNLQALSEALKENATEDAQEVAK